MDKMSDSGLLELIKRGEELFQGGDLSGAEQEFKKALKIAPKNPEVLNNLGVIASARSELNRAEEYFLSALKVDKTNHDAILNLVDLLNLRGEWERSAVYL
jgi:Flp pilus assembly protein TadD